MLTLSLLGAITKYELGLNLVQERGGEKRDQKEFFFFSTTGKADIMDMNCWRRSYFGVQITQLIKGL